MGAPDPLIFEDDAVPLGEVRWRKQYRVALVHPQHDGAVYISPTFLAGWHVPRICPDCGTPREQGHRDDCVRLAVAIA